MFKQYEDIINDIIHMFTFIVNGHFINVGIGEDNIGRKYVDPLNFASRSKQSAQGKQ